jgi:iron complex outermembrane receptor protein
MRAEPRDIDSWVSHTLTFNWETPWNGRLAAGARNLFDRDPPIDLEVEPDYTAFYYLYPIEGRVLFVNYTQRFQ